LEKLGADVICPNLLPTNEPFNELQEEEAYHYFTEHVGFKKGSAAINRIINQVHKRYDEIYLVGFSVGATIAWICSTQNAFLKRTICFYGSRIRDYYQLNPQCPVTLFLASIEKSFNVHDFVAKLNKRKYKNLDIQLFKAKHGFANSYSGSFNKCAYQETLTQIESMIQK
jgi:dienelactone hydrolase